MIRNPEELEAHDCHSGPENGCSCGNYMPDAPEDHYSDAELGKRPIKIKQGYVGELADEPFDIYSSKQ